MFLLLIVTICIFVFLYGLKMEMIYNPWLDGVYAFLLMGSSCSILITIPNYFLRIIGKSKRSFYVINVSLTLISKVIITIVTLNYYGFGQYFALCLVFDIFVGFFSLLISRIFLVFSK